MCVNANRVYRQLYSVLSSVILQIFARFILDFFFLLRFIQYEHNGGRNVCHCENMAFNIMFVEILAFVA